MNKQNGVYPYNGVLFGHEREVLRQKKKYLGNYRRSENQRLAESQSPVQTRGEKPHWDQKQQIKSFSSGSWQMHCLC